MNKIKKIVLVIFSFSFFLFSLILFFNSKIKKDSSYQFSSGKDVIMFKYKFDANHLIGMIVGLLLLGYAIYNLYNEYKNQKNNPIVLPIVLAVLFGLLASYSGSIFFENIIENDAKFKDMQLYFYGFIVFIIISAYFIIDFISKKKENN